MIVLQSTWKWAISSPTFHKNIIWKYVVRLLKYIKTTYDEFQTNCIPTCKWWGVAVGHGIVEEYSARCVTLYQCHLPVVRGSCWTWDSRGILSTLCITVTYQWWGVAVGHEIVEEYSARCVTLYQCHLPVVRGSCWTWDSRGILTILCNTVTYQWRGVAVGHEIVEEYGQVCWMMLQTVQVWERSVFLQL